jgi:hypothetical protein
MLGIIALMYVQTAQVSYQEETASVDASVVDKTISFSVTASNNSPPIYGFIAASVNHGHYAKVVKSPDGWSPGNLKYHVAMWTTQSDPILPGETEIDFATEVTRRGTYEIRWSVLDESFQPVDWGILTVIV